MTVVTDKGQNPARKGVSQHSGAGFEPGENNFHPRRKNFLALRKFSEAQENLFNDANICSLSRYLASSFSGWKRG